jgi:hypothetical protein
MQGIPVCGGGIHNEEKGSDSKVVPLVAYPLAPPEPICLAVWGGTGVETYKYWYLRFERTVAYGQVCDEPGNDAAPPDDQAPLQPEDPVIGCTATGDVLTFCTGVPYLPSPVDNEAFCNPRTVDWYNGGGVLVFELFLYSDIECKAEVARFISTETAVDLFGGSDEVVAYQVKAAGEAPASVSVRADAANLATTPAPANYPPPGWLLRSSLQTLLCCCSDRHSSVVQPSQWHLDLTVQCFCPARG